METEPSRTLKRTLTDCRSQAVGGSIPLGSTTSFRDAAGDCCRLRAEAPATQHEAERDAGAVHQRTTRLGQREYVSRGDSRRQRARLGPPGPPGLFPRAREGRGGRRPDQFRGRFAADLRLARSDHAAIRSQLRDAGGSADKDMAEVTR